MDFSNITFEPVPTPVSFVNDEPWLRAGQLELIEKPQAKEIDGVYEVTYRFRLLGTP